MGGKIRLSVAAAAGVSDYVVKACGFAELRERVTRLMPGHRAAFRGGLL